MIKVFVNGTFDILHPGHIDLLNYAKSQGDYLLVAIDSDCRVKQFKGLSRPVCDQHTRQYTLKNLKAVDQTEMFNSDQQLTDIIKSYSPHIMIVGSDYKDKKVIGSEHAKELKFYDRQHNYSTSKILQDHYHRRLLSR
jgi:D-beta-D-heptose 7-phosphate kinase/D-beta-D-heptose 1-phosphate adenosyltransferase